MNTFTKTSYNTWKRGEYAYTAHAIEAGGWFYIAWWKDEVLGQFDDADQARAAVQTHSEKRN